MKPSLSVARRPVPGVLAGLILIFTGPLLAAEPVAGEVVHAGPDTTLDVPIYKSRIVELPAPAKRVSIGNPDIADVLIIKSSELYVLGKDLGTTNVLLWDRDDRLISAVSVTVTHDLGDLKARLAAILPNEHIQVTSAQRNIILSGQVSSTVRMDAALQIAKSYLEQAATAKEKIMFQQQQGTGGANQDKLAGEVINLMTVAGAQQVMLQVKVAEVRRDALKHLNLQMNAINNAHKWVGGAVNGGATFPPINWLPENAPVVTVGSPGTSGIVGPLQSGVTPTLPAITSSGLFGSYMSGAFVANAILDAFQQKGLAKILAEPTLTTLTGQEAQFLSGGSFPIPVPEFNGTIGITYKDFGVKIVFLPMILDDGRINLKLNVSVSELTSANSLVVSPITSNTVFAVPALTERRAISTVELADGQSIGIAGLLNETMQNAAKKFPGLGDIPILGQLFRSQDFQKGQTELLILVTPRLAKPLPPGEVRLPTDSVVDPSNIDFFLLGRMEGRKEAAKSSEKAAAPGSDPPAAGLKQSPTPAQPGPTPTQQQTAPAERTAPTQYNEVPR